MAEYFKLLTEAIFNHLLGIKPDYTSKFSPLLHSKNPGEFGKARSAFGVVEEQSRGSPHCHVVVWGELSPKLLQSVSGFPALREEIADILDNMVSAELQLSTTAMLLINQFPGGEKPDRPALRIAHNPVENPNEFETDVQIAGAFCNIHNHTLTCRKGKSGKTKCRLGRPQPLAESTNVVQLIPTRNELTKKVEVTISHEPASPSIDSLPGRDFSRTPVARRDNTLYFWELKRREHKLRNKEGFNDDHIRQVCSS